MKLGFYSKQSGFTLMETLIGAAVFLVIATAAYQAYASLFALIAQNQYKINALNLLNEQFEIVRNMPYSNIGVQGSIPNGVIPYTQNITRANINFVVTTTVRNIDLEADGVIGGTPADLSPADNKVVEIEVRCPTCKDTTPLTLTTNVAPKGLETASNNGALFIRVFDSNGIPIQGAEVNIVNNKVTPSIVINDVTDNSGMLQVVDVPPGNEAYEITVTKPGYSTDKTYLTGEAGNPNPTKPHATVLLQQLTQISFSIDKLSTLSISSVTPECAQVDHINFSMTGSKMIGANVPKYMKNHTTGSTGTYLNDATEWDFYTTRGIDTDYDVVGVNPLNPISVNPDSTQHVRLIVAPKDPNSLLITVKDGATQLPVTDAQVRVTRGGTYDEIAITGRGAIHQTNWAGGSGQDNFSNVNRYFFDDGNIEINNPAGELKLRDNGFGEYNPDGFIESSTIDTGSASNFYNLIWTPTDQPVLAGTDSVRIQFATSASSTPDAWEYLGPDGTAGTYYTTPNSPLASVHNGDRYARYRIYLDTETATSTPNISDISFTVTSDCTPPGQVVFSGLTAGTYQVEVSKSGYNTQTVDVNVNNPWLEEEILLSP